MDTCSSFGQDRMNLSQWSAFAIFCYKSSKHPTVSYTHAWTRFLWTSISETTKTNIIMTKKKEEWGNELLYWLVLGTTASICIPVTRIQSITLITPRQNSISTTSLTIGRSPAWCTPIPLRRRLCIPTTYEGGQSLKHWLKQRQWYSTKFMSY